MNLTRVQGHGDPWGVGDSGSDGLNHSRSPALSFDCDDCSIDLTVALRRQESGFGFRIVGGTEEGSQVGWGSCQQLWKTKRLSQNTESSVSWCNYNFCCI